MTRTKTVFKTEEVEIEIVECSSCGQEIPKEKAHEFEIKGKNEADGLTGVKAGVGSHGWACDYCVENDPIGFPDPGPKWEIDTPFILNFVLWALLAVSLLIVIL